MEGVTDEKQYTLHVINGKCEVINQDVCDGCGVCVEACSMKALKLEQVER
jgi:NAD-dependent dihydropyrimidine dehydrogenase PreA subunit